MPNNYTGRGGLKCFITTKLLNFTLILRLAAIAVGMGKSGAIATSTGGRMKESEKWLALCDTHCPFRRHFPSCVCCDIALEYRRCKSEEQAEEGE